MSGVTGVNVNPASGYPSQATSTFLIKGNAPSEYRADSAMSDENRLQPALLDDDHKTLENIVVLHLSQAMLGLVSTNLRAAAAEVTSDRLVIHFAFLKPSASRIGRTLRTSLLTSTCCWTTKWSRRRGASSLSSISLCGHELAGASIPQGLRGQAV